MDLNASSFSSNSCSNEYGTNVMENLNNFSLQATNGLSEDFRLLKIVCDCIILLGSSFGNSLVIYIIASNVRMRTPSNILILNLAVCDFVTPVVSLPFDFVLQEYNYVWTFGTATCKILWPLTSMTSTSAALALAAISFSRLQCSKCFRSYQTVTRESWEKIVYFNFQSKLLFTCINCFLFHLFL